MYTLFILVIGIVIGWALTVGITLYRVARDLKNGELNAEAEEVPVGPRHLWGKNIPQ